ncbi:DUF6887 family protein [Planktothrix agardhii]|jgi:predicted esterase|uniref:Similar to tr/Q7NFX5/Q7NFX5 n=1 Tax=Planktothrix agardhii TaxID=1160 RepID=A0A1J1JCE8_PLAAG|nr:hypothetical protein [Planktothrix agardhii]BBD56693.1 hypothetical protein NIES204_40260 [Planktothrix agardhii NIES-204]MCB8750904.1 hypothetical protein [Planktothrix agardhii 1810]MCB8759649.1 hypothetical protein [Planktothrix agardhii 1813]MCB8764597.1 hypothetical protein [Planktothrix agardhii 1809]MCB8766279.1 hypothetical protein [Planktothrix agardhii 1809]
MISDFEKMTNAELKAYALEHRGEEDVEALRVLFRRRKPYAQDLTFYPAKNQQEKQEQIERFKQIIEEKQGQKIKDTTPPLDE